MIKINHFLVVKKTCSGKIYDYGSVRYVYCSICGLVDRKTHKRNLVIE